MSERNVCAHSEIYDNLILKPLKSFQRFQAMPKKTNNQQTKTDKLKWDIEQGANRFFVFFFELVDDVGSALSELSRIFDDNNGL